MKTTTNYKVLVDIPVKVGTENEHKLIFSRNGETSFLFKVKKFFWKEQMQEAAAKKIKTIFEDYSKTDATFENPFKNIIEKEGVDEFSLINALKILDQHRGLKLKTKNSSIDPNEALTIINERTKKYKLINEICELAKTNCSNLVSEDIINDCFENLKIIDQDNLNKIRLDDCSNILMILKDLNKKIPNISNNFDKDKIRDYIDHHIKLLTPHQTRMEEKLLNKEACEARVNEIKISKNKIAVFLKTKISVFNEIDNENAFKAFINFLEDPTATLKPTREIISNEVLTNKHDKYLENFLAIFAKNASKLTDGKSKDLCFDAVDYLTGSLLAAVNSDIRFDPPFSAATEQVELKSALRKNWEQYGPSGFLLHLLNYDKSGIDAIDHRSYLTLNHLLNDHQRLAQITNNLPESLQASFSKKMQSLENDLALFKKNSVQAKIDNRAEAKVSDKRKMIIEYEVESREDLPRKQDRLLNTNVARTKVTDSIKGILTNISAFKENNEIIPALTSFIDFLNRTNDFSFNKNNKRDLDQFFVIFFDNIKTLTPDHRMLCLKEVDILEGMLLQYKNNDIDAIDISKIKNNSIFDLATGIQFLSHAIPPSGNLSHLLFYLKDGKSSINMINYWGLQYFCQSQHTQIKDSLHEPLRSYFQTQIEQLRKDLADLKPVYQARTT
jgi:hypothetical protein